MAWIAKNEPLNSEEMHNNAKMFRDFFSAQNWTLNAIAGVLGNMQSESVINPGAWQNYKVNYNMGFGLVQWTPATKYINWAGSDYQNGALQCSRIVYELNNGLQYYPTNKYPLTFKQFVVSTDTPYNLGMAFLLNYERPADQNQPIRGRQAEYWYNYFGGDTPTPPDPPDPPDPPEPAGNIHKTPLWMMIKKHL